MVPEGFVRAEEWKPLPRGLERRLETPSRKKMNSSLEVACFGEF